MGAGLGARARGGALDSWGIWEEGGGGGGCEVLCAREDGHPAVDRYFLRSWYGTG